MKSVAVLVGSLSRQSINRTLANGIIKAGSDRLAFRISEIGDLPLYNRDLDGDMPAPARRFKAEIEAADAMLIVSPEFNRSFSAIVKNAVEWGSRPDGKSSFMGTPAATAGASGGNISTAIGQQHVRGVLTHLGMHVLPQPEMFIKFQAEAYAEDGAIRDETLKKLVDDFIDKFAAHIARF